MTAKVISCRRQSSLSTSRLLALMPNLHLPSPVRAHKYCDKLLWLVCLLFVASSVDSHNLSYSLKFMTYKCLDRSRVRKRSFPRKEPMRAIAPPKASMPWPSTFQSSLSPAAVGSHGDPPSPINLPPQRPWNFAT